MVNQFGHKTGELQPSSADILSHEFPRSVMGKELLDDNFKRLPTEVERCNSDAIRLIRSSATNNCIARSNGEIDREESNNNSRKINAYTEEFIEKCIIMPVSRYHEMVSKLPPVI